MFEFDHQQILAIAREAVNRKGFVEYADYNEYLRELICRRELDPMVGWRLFDIKRILLDPRNTPQDRYLYKSVGRKAYFYPIRIQ